MMDVNRKASIRGHKKTIPGVSPSPCNIRAIRLGGSHLGGSPSRLSREDQYLEDGKSGGQYLMALIFVVTMKN